MNSRDRKAKGFARQLAAELRQARTEKRFARAILIAPAAFMGLLNAELDPPTAQQISARLEKDYTRLSPSELCEELVDSLLRLIFAQQPLAQGRVARPGSRRDGTRTARSR